MNDLAYVLEQALIEDGERPHRGHNLGRTHRGGHDMTATIGQHGYGGYSRGCRCDTCRTAKADYMANKRAKARRARLAGRKTVKDITHGISGYRDQSCRCDTCIDANRQANRRETANLGRRRYRATPRPTPPQPPTPEAGDEVWRRRAACRGHDLDQFVIAKSGTLSRANNRALALCEACPVRQPCHDEWAAQPTIRRAGFIAGGIAWRGKKDPRSLRRQVVA